MKNTSIIFLIIGLPIFSLGQLKGTYFFSGGMFSQSYSFEQDNKFSYRYMNDLDGELGKGRYAVNKDTLTFFFENFLDSGKFDCSSVKYQNLANKEHKDSIKLDFTILDCRSGKAVGYAHISFNDSLSLKHEEEKEEILTDEKGKYSITISTNDPFPEIIVYGPEHEVQSLSINPNQESDLSLTVSLLWWYYSDVQAGEKHKYLIVEKNKKYMVLQPLEYQKEQQKLYIKSRRSWGKKKWIRKLKKFYPEIYLK